MFYLTNDIFKMDIPPYEFKVYTYLVMRADRQTNKCFPSVQTIANDCGISESRVRRAMLFLEENHLIDVKPQFKKLSNGKVRQSSNLYTILPLPTV